MKMHLVGVFAAFCLAAPVASAQSATVTADIPFAFTVGNTQCSPGTWVIERSRDNPLLQTLYSQDRRHRFIVLAVARMDGSNAPGLARLKFNKYGGEYFLSEIWRNFGDGTQLRAGRAERELIAAGSRAQSVPVVLAGTK
jgi:hypothetical protein